MTSADGSLRVGTAMYKLIENLYPICRSITGDGVRQTLQELQKIVPLTIHEVPTGTQVLDWVIPKEWNVKDAYVATSAGDRVIDFRRNNLHLVSYSVPMRTRMSLADLRSHLHSVPDRPDVIPYRTTYYREDWGFCLSHSDMEKLREDDYEVVVDTSLSHGSLSYGEFSIPGSSAEEILLTAHCCHPSLANDNLTGIALATIAAQALLERQNRFTYRFLFIPGTIGSITWLARNESRLGHIRAGLVLTGLGDDGSLTYKKSRQGDALIDRVAARVLVQSDTNSSVREFSPYGYDERQFCSPGFDLPIGRLSRTPHGEYSEYHTSADNLDFIKPSRMAESYRALMTIIESLESDARYLSLKPKGEPQLGKYGLYRPTGGSVALPNYEMALLWILNLSDGTYSLQDIADRSGLSLEVLQAAAKALIDAKLLASCSGS